MSDNQKAALAMGVALVVYWLVENVVAIRQWKDDYIARMLVTVDRDKLRARLRLSEGLDAPAPDAPLSVSPATPSDGTGSPGV